MPDDIRISLSFRHHRKRKKLFQRLGENGVLALIDLWCTVAEQNPTGVLIGYSKEDVEIDAEWKGESGLCVKNILEIGFIQETKNGFYLHNWDIRQPWVYKSDERSDKSRFSRMAKIYPDIYQQLHIDGVRAISKKDYLEITSVQRFVNAPLTKTNDSLTPAPAPTPVPTPTPVPDPVPNPAPKVKKKIQKKKVCFEKYLQKKIIDHNFIETKDKIFEFYNWRMDDKIKGKKQPYESEKGIDGLFRNMCGCRKAGLIVSDCLDIAMERPWLTPDPTYK